MAQCWKEHIVEHCERLLAGFMRYTKVVGTIMAEYGLSESQSQAYITEVRKRWREAGDLETEDLAARKAQIRHNLEEESKRAPDVATRLKANKLLMDLDGLQSPQRTEAKHEHVGLNLNESNRVHNSSVLKKRLRELVEERAQAIAEERAKGGEE